MKPVGEALSYLSALLAGVLLALSFPRFGQSAFAWIALVPLLVAVSARARHSGASRPLRAFGLGWVTGVAYFAGTVYWTGAVIRTYGGLSLPVAIGAAGALVAYLALFPALFALMLSWLSARIGAVALLLAPAIWVTSELARSYFWSGFPWVLLGYSQTRVLPVAQLASLFGVYGLSALVALCNAAVAYVVTTRSRTAAMTAAAVGVCIVVVAWWGSSRMREGALTREGTLARVALVQGNVPQDQKWNPARANAILERYLAMTREAARRGARFVVWPESSTPFYFEEDRFDADRVRAVVRETGIDLMLGSDQIERGNPPKYYNSAFVLRADGGTAGVYRKMYLVPFGEYVPLKRLLFFVAPLVDAVADFSPGQGVVTLPVDGFAVSTAICYEIVYPGLVRQMVLAGSGLLTTITNDAWYGQSSAPYQHFEQASMRAIEQGRYLVRSANTGISGIVDPYGRVVVKSALFEPAVLVGDVRVLSGLTVYGRIGDLLAYLCAAVTVGAAIAAWRRRR
jgi:apolipoprotein N-acyltransferase